MSAPDAPDEVLLARVTIERVLTGDEDRVDLRVEDSGDGRPPLIEVLGMLAMARDSAVTLYAGDGEDEE